MHHAVDRTYHPRRSASQTANIRRGCGPAKATTIMAVAAATGSTACQEYGSSPDLQAVGRTWQSAKHQSRQGGAHVTLKRAADRRRRAAHRRLRTSRPRSSERTNSRYRDQDGGSSCCRETAGRCRMSEPAAETHRQRQRRTAVQADHGGRIAVEFRHTVRSAPGGRYSR